MTDNYRVSGGWSSRAGRDGGVVVALIVGILAGLFLHDWWISILVGLITAILIETARRAWTRHTAGGARRG